MALEPIEIAPGTGKPPVQIMVFIVIIVVACVLDIASTAGPHAKTWVLMIGMVLLGTVLAVLSTRRSRSRFVLDEEGFGYAGYPHMARWEEVESFGVIDLPRGRFFDQWKVVTIKFRPGVKKWSSTVTALDKFLGTGTGDGSIVFIWPRPHEVIAEELNSYRRKALGEQLSD